MASRQGRSELTPQQWAVLEAMAREPEQRLRGSIYKIARHRFARLWKVPEAGTTISRMYVHASTVAAVIARGYVRIAGEGTDVYRLTDAGRAALANEVSRRSTAPTKTVATPEAGKKGRTRG